MLIYRHTNIKNGKHYIGQTKYSMEERWKGHVHAATRADRKGSAFQNALRKHGTDCWEHHIIVENVPDYMAKAFEKYWINYYDSFKNGYNSTLGGDYFDGYKPPKKEKHHSFKQSKLHFYHKSGTIEFLYGYELAEKYNLKYSSVQSLVMGRQRNLFGWALNAKDCERVYRKSINTVPKRTILESKISSPRIPITINESRFISKLFTYKETKMYKGKTPIDDAVYQWNHPKRGSERYKQIVSERTSGKKNGMYGKKRPQYVKDAVSKRMKASADQTPRDWTHKEFGDELQITCIGLRDKYNLNISHLNKIATGKCNQHGNPIVQHKGWRLK